MAPDFEEWWKKKGWGEKALAESAFRAGIGYAMNYRVDCEAQPEQVTFDGGIVVTAIARDVDDAYLVIGPRGGR